MAPRKRVTMNDHAAEASPFKRRAIVIFICVVSLLALLLANLYQLQIISFQDYTTRSNDNRIRIVPCLLYTSPSPRDGLLSRMPSSA